MEIALTPEMEKFVRAKVASGRYDSVEEAIDDGLRLLEERDRFYNGRFDELKKEVEVGIEELDRGEGLEGETAMQQLRDEVLQRDRRE